MRYKRHAVVRRLPLRLYHRPGMWRLSGYWKKSYVTITCEDSRTLRSLAEKLGITEKFFERARVRGEKYLKGQQLLRKAFEAKWREAAIRKRNQAKARAAKRTRARREARNRRTN